MLALTFGESGAPHVHHYLPPHCLTLVRDVVLPMLPVYIRMVLFPPYRSFLCLDRPVQSSVPPFRVSPSFSVSHNFAVHFSGWLTNNSPLVQLFNLFLASFLFAPLQSVIPDLSCSDLGCVVGQPPSSATNYMSLIPCFVLPSSCFKYFGSTTITLSLSLFFHSSHLFVPCAF